MQIYRTDSRVQAIQYQFHSNEAEVATFVAANSNMSWDNTRGFLYFYNDGPEVVIHPTEWAVRLGDRILVLADQQFQKTFVPSNATDLIEHPLTTEYPIAETEHLHARLDAWLEDRKIDGRSAVSYNEWTDRVEIRVVLPH